MIIVWFRSFMNFNESLYCRAYDQTVDILKLYRRIQKRPIFNVLERYKDDLDKIYKYYTDVKYQL